MAQTRKNARDGARKRRPISRYTGWKLEDAKARFSEVVRRAQSEGPQRVTVHGQDAVVVIAADEFERMLPRAAELVPFVAFMEGLAVDGLNLTREPDLGRDVDL